MGYMTINLFNYHAEKEYEFNYRLMDLIHNFIHVLGFHRDMLPFFINTETGFPLDEKGEKYWENREGRYFIKTPSVYNFTQHHYNCFDFTGFPMGDQGQSDS